MNYEKKTQQKQPDQQQPGQQPRRPGEDEKEKDR